MEGNVLYSGTQIGRMYNYCKQLHFEKTDALVMSARQIRNHQHSWSTLRLETTRQKSNKINQTPVLKLTCIMLTHLVQQIPDHHTVEQESKRVHVLSVKYYFKYLTNSATSSLLWSCSGNAFHRGLVQLMTNSWWRKKPVNITRHIWAIV